MTKLNRVTAKIFGETASPAGDDPQIGQFGSAKIGTYLGTNDISTIQELPAWSNGWIDAVTPNQQFPTLPEMTGVHKVLSQQIAYLLQQGISEWDDATTYYTNNFCAKNGKLYISKTDKNLNNDPENDSTNWEEFTMGGNGNEVGDTVWRLLPSKDAGKHLLDGTLLNAGSYSGFVNYIADLYADNPNANYFTDETTWQATVAQYGACGKFVYDSTNNTVRLPKVTGIVEGTIDATALGDLIEAGLPNVRQYIGRTEWYNSRFPSCVIDSYASGMTFADDQYATDSLGYLTVDLSHSNSIYKDNFNKVQPQTIKGYYYIVVATSTKTDIQVDIDEIATDLNGKADVDLTNTTNQAKILMSRMAMPSNRYIDLTLGASGATYTAPANGWFWITYEASINVTGGWVVFSNMNNGIIAKSWSIYSFGTSILLPVEKGEVMQMLWGGNPFVTNVYFRFYYAQGSESEAS